MNPIVLIPARLAASRLPGKPLADIGGTPMIVHVWRRAVEADLGPVLVAADDPRIADAVAQAGGTAVLTRADHPSGTDRIAEALARADPDRRHDVVVNFQGDLPTLAPHVPRATARLLDDPEVDIGTAVARALAGEADQPSVVKMAGTLLGPDRFRCHYFSRARVPWGDGLHFHHIGLYAWRRAALERFVALPPSPLELRERLEQLRALEAGMRIDAALVDDIPLGVDTQADLDRARAILSGTAPVTMDRAAAQAEDPATARAAASVARTIALERDGLAALDQALPHGLAAAFARAASIIGAAAGTVIVSGMGKSGHVGRKIAATFASTGTPSHFVHPAEASHGDLGVIRETDVVLAISWSGETPELADIVAYTRRFEVPLLAMTSQADSALGTAADVALVLPTAQEACPNGLAPTTSTTMQLAAGDALAILLLEQRGFSARDFQLFHPGGKLGARLTTVGALMHTGDELPVVRLEATLSQGIVEMTSKRFGIAGVVDARGLLVGALTDGDLRRAFRAGFVDRPVRDAMGQRPYTLPADALAVAALAQMNEARITCIFVTDTGRPVGLVHIHDLLRAGIA